MIPSHPRFVHLRARHTNLARRRSLSIQHWVNIHQQPIIDDGVVYNITKIQKRVNSSPVVFSYVPLLLKPLL